MKRRRTFGRDFKLKAVRYANSCAGESMTNIAKELEIDRQALWSWIREVEVKGEELAFPGRGRRSPRRDLTTRLQHAAGTPEDFEPLYAEIELLRMKLERTKAERDAVQGILDRLLDIKAADIPSGKA